MNNKKILSVFILIMVLSFTSSVNAREKGKQNEKIKKVTTNDITETIAINEILMYFRNNGNGSFNPQTDGAGLYWPGGPNATLTAIFEDGLMFAGKVGTEIRAGGNNYRNGLQAGPIIDGKAADPADTKYRIYKIRKGFEGLPPGSEKDRLTKDYNEWPVDDGAPWVDVDGDGIFTRGVDEPEFIGDEVNWMVMNDLDPSRTTFLYGTQPMGLEVQCTVFGFNRTGPLGNMVFKKYKVINKGINTIRDMIMGYWSDPDLGYANDDYVGCDTLLSIGYVYNGDNNDEDYYGTPPPAAAYDFFQGPIIPYDPVKYPIIIEKNLPDSAKFDGKWIKGKTNLPLTSFSFYINGSTIYSDPTLGSPDGAIQMYNYMTSKLWNGDPFIDPNTGQPARFCLPGDPVNKTGWYEGDGWPGGQAPNDRRIMMSSGPFTMAPGDTQEVVVAIILARGSDNINSIKVLKDVDLAAQTAYDLNFKLTPPPDAPKVMAKGLDGKVVLYWEDNSESYDAEDPLIKGQPGVDDYTYNFQGYEIYQYRNEAGADPVLLATYDVVDSTAKILDYQNVMGENVLLPVASGSNSGLVRTYEISADKYTQGPLHNGTPYYFGVVAYGYSKNSSPKVLKNTHVPVEVFPQTPGIDEEYAYDSGDYLDIVKSGNSDGIVKVLVIDPDKLTGDQYKVVIDTAGGSLSWTLINVTKNLTLLSKQTNFLTLADLQSSDVKNLIINEQKIIDGFMIAVANPASTSGIKEVVMIKDGDKVVEPSGNIATFIPREGINVIGKSAQRGWWIGTTLDKLYQDIAGEDDFELRFTSEPNQYYTATFNLRNDLHKKNPVGRGTVPFQFWNIKDKNNPNDDFQMYVKSYEYPPKNANDVKPDEEIPDSTWNGKYADITRLDKDSVKYNELYFIAPENNQFISPLPDPSFQAKKTDYPINKVILMAKSLDQADFPKAGTVIRFTTWKKLKYNEEFSFTASKPKKNNAELAKESMDKISVFPNPYFGYNELERDKYQRFVRFTNLPSSATIRIYSLSGTFIQEIVKVGGDQFVDWNLRNSEGLAVASGMYLAYIEMPGIGNKVLKIAVIQEKQYIDRL